MDENQDTTEQPKTEVNESSENHKEGLDKLKAIGEKLDNPEKAAGAALIDKTGETKKEKQEASEAPAGNAEVVKEEALAEVARTSEIAEAEPSVESENLLHNAMGDAKALGLSDAAIDGARQIGADKHEQEAQGSTQDLTKLETSLKEEIIKSQEMGRPTANLRETMKSLPISKLHTDVTKNAQSADELSKRLAAELQKSQEKKKQQGQSVGPRVRASFS